MKIPTILFTIAAGFVALLSSCTTSHILVGPTRTPTDPARVKIYATPPKHYETIAVVSADSKVSFQLSAQGKVDTAMERARKEAAALGANGLLLQNVSDSGGGVSSVVGVGTHSDHSFVGVSSGATNKQVTLLAIFVTEE